MCTSPAEYAKFTEPGSERGIVRELAALAKKRNNPKWLAHNCGDKFPKAGHARAEFACHHCFVWKMWPYELQTLP
jgi:hypothetical protein